MHKKLNFKDEEGIVTQTVVSIPGPDHLLAQQKYRASVYKNKKKTQTKKPKYPKDYYDNE